MTTPVPLPPERRLTPENFELKFNENDGTVVLNVKASGLSANPIVEVVIYDLWNGDDDYHFSKVTAPPDASTSPWERSTLTSSFAFNGPIESGAFSIASWTPGYDNGEYHRIWQSNYRTGTEAADEVERWIECSDGAASSTFASWSEWVDALFALGITNPGSEGMMTNADGTTTSWGTSPRKDSERSDAVHVAAPDSPERWCINHEEPCPLPCAGCDADCPPGLAVDAAMVANPEACDLLRAEFS